VLYSIYGIDVRRIRLRIVDMITPDGQIRGKKSHYSSKCLTARTISQLVEAE